MSGGKFSIVGWVLEAVSATVQTPGAPVLAIGKIAGGSEFIWPLPSSGWLLDESPSVKAFGRRSLFLRHKRERISVTIPDRRGNIFIGWPTALRVAEV